MHVMHAMFWYRFFCKMTSIHSTTTSINMQHLKNCFALYVIVPVDASTGRHCMNLTFSLYELHMSNASEEQIRSFTCKNQTPRCLHLFVDSTLLRILIGTWCLSLAPAQIMTVPSNHRLHISSSMYDKRTFTSSCLGSAHFAHVTTISLTSWQFLRSIYADWSAAPLLWRSRDLGGTQRVPRWCV